MLFVLVDYLHLAHKCMAVPPLKTVVNVNGEMTEVDTTIPSITIKNIVKFSGRGAYYTGVFLEGGNGYRKRYFGTGGVDYKGNRPGKTTPFYNGVNLTTNLLLNGGVSVYRKSEYEADDLIGSMVVTIKRYFENAQIVILTCDADMLPLVDDQVSVFMRSTRTYAEQSSLEQRLYYQVTPRSWRAYLESTSAYKQFYIPYNSILLFKMIRGDSSDNVPMAIKGYGGKKYSALMHQMESDGVDFEQVFRYGVDFDSVMQPILCQYFSEDEVKALKFNYQGICLRQDVEFTSKMVPQRIFLEKLQRALLPVDIHIFK